MSSLEVTLDEFVTKIPLCQVNDSWENIVKALCSSPSSFIAFVDANSCPQGILESHKLLAHLAHKTVVSGIIAETISQSGSESMASLPTTELTNLISQITTLSVNSNIKELIFKLNNQECLISEQNYLILDAAGKVQGILDFPKLLKHLAKVDPSTEHQIDRQSASHHLEEIRLVEHQFPSLEQIPVSLMLQHDEGNIGELPQETQNNQEPLAEVTEVGMQPISDLNKLKRLQNELMINISHDLKSPLTAIISLSSLLREEKLGSLNSRQIRYLDLIYRGARQLMSIVTDLLDITSLATGKLRLKLESIDLEKLCHQAYQQVVTKLEAVHGYRHNKPLVSPELQFDLQSDSSEVIADRLRLNQILIRLLENAVSANPAEEAVGIRIERWDDWVAISVWDRGRGISETSQSSLLEEMFEPDIFLTSPEKTTGLGLILAQQLAQSHGGDISFTSQINHGSEFTLLLPANPLKMPNPEPGTVGLAEESTSVANHHNQSTLVLIVERSAMRISDLTENLHKLGYHTAIARNQQEALYKATHLQPSKIILNHELIHPKEQNILTQLKSNPQTANIPLLLTCRHQPNSEYLYFHAEYLLLSPNEQINPERLAEYFPPLTSKNSSQYYCQGQKLTMLRLCLTNEESSPTGSEIDFLFDDPSVNLCHHIIEADSIEQANMLARIWKIDTIIWDSSHLELPLDYLRSLSSFPYLAQIPIVTLDEKTTAAANQFDNLIVFPCLVPINDQNITELMQIIQSAANSG
ncbi:MAG: ATP-binding protein [Xenococcus sp. (in: cyanobacteria)]